MSLPQAAPILVVTPNRAARRRLRGALAASGWRVIEADGVADAVSAARRQAHGAILCDDLVPDGSWKDLLSGLTQEAPPVIVLTRDGSEALWQEVLDAGGFDLVDDGEPQEILRVLELAVLTRCSDLSSLEAATKARNADPHAVTLCLGPTETLLTTSLVS